MLTIGEFSDRCGLSAKVLRTYGDAGLLRPAAVDSATGYRYYSADQLPVAALIASLRQASVPLTDIAAFLAAPDPARFDEWADTIASESSHRRRALSNARTMWNGEAAMTSNHPSGASTHVGGRSTNQDAVLARDGLWAVADGIGGLPGGEDASHTAIESLEAAFSADPSLAGLVGAVQIVNRAIAQGGSTLTALAVTADAGVAFVHVGDSRIYRLRRDTLSQLTADHTVVADLVAAGDVTDVEAAAHEQRFVLTRAVGVGPAVRADYGSVDTRPGDWFLLCTDGVHRHLDATIITRLLDGDPQASADALIAEALRAGTTDNVSAVAIAF